MKAPQPYYPASARSIRVTGAVLVAVKVDENGNSILAKAIEGHPLLREAAEDAAKKAKFVRTLIENEPAKFEGFIIYYFKPNF